MIRVHTTLHAQIAEPLFCNFHNEVFGIIIKMKGKRRRTTLRELRTALQGPPCSVLQHHYLNKWLVSRTQEADWGLLSHEGFEQSLTCSNCVREFVAAADRSLLIQHQLDRFIVPICTEVWAHWQVIIVWQAQSSVVNSFYPLSHH